MDINKVFLVGRLVRDPEVRTTPDGTPLVRMRLAVNRAPGRDGTQQTDFIDVVAWRKLAELCERYLTKGRRIAVDGSLRQSSWQNAEGKTSSRVEVVAQNIQFLDRREGAGAGAVEAEPTATAAGASISDDTLHVLNGDLVEDIDDFVFEEGDE